MINKQSIYYWFFFPLLALLSAGSLTSCIYDSVLEETDMSGKSTLSITMRGVTTNPSDGYDEYIETLRIIGFDANGNVVCNQLFDNDVSTTEIPDFTVQGTGEDAQINITQTMEAAFQGGVCDFYFIANEKDYTVYNTQSNIQLLSNFLDEVSLNGLKNCVIAYDGKEPGATNQRSILMTTSVTSALKPGDNTINDIELVRCFAKLQLKIVNKSGEEISVTNPKINGSYPISYSLWNGSSSENWNQNDPHYEIDLDPLNQGSVTDDAQNYPLYYYSTEVYFPERLFLDANNNKDNAITFSFTLNNKTYNVEVADATGTDFNIRRNTHYTVIATLKKKETVTFNVMVNAWGEKTMDVPAFE